MLYLTMSKSLKHDCLPAISTTDRGLPVEARPLAAYELYHALARSVFKGDPIISDALDYLEYFAEVRCSDYADLADFLQAVKRSLKQSGDWVCWPLAVLFGRWRLSGFRDVLRQRRLTLIDVGRSLGLSGWRAVGAVWLWDRIGIPKRRLLEVAQVLNVSVDTLLKAEHCDVWFLSCKRPA